MASRFNTLYHGLPEDVVNVLERTDAKGLARVSEDDLRLALINTLTRLKMLEDRIVVLEIAAQFPQVEKEGEFEE